MKNNFLTFLAGEIATLKQNGLYKTERVITSPQQAEISIADDEAHVLNFCANNYLGLSDNADLITAGQKALEKYGFGLSSVRFICGTQTVHKDLEKQISQFLQKKMRFYILPVLMRTAVYLKPCSANRMPS